MVGVTLAESDVESLTFAVVFYRLSICTITFGLVVHILSYQVDPCRGHVRFCHVLDNVDTTYMI